MHSQSPVSSFRANRSGVWAKLFLVLTVLGVPLGAKWVLTVANAADSGQIQPVAALNFPRKDHTATLLMDGRVLIAGGRDINGVLASAEIFLPSTKSFLAVEGLHSARAGHAATLLRDGRVLIIGGENAQGRLDSSEIFDPAILSFAVGAPMTTGRSGHTATRLATGKVLIAGGDVGGTAELFNPADGSFSATTGPLLVPRSGHSATLFSDNNVFLAGAAPGRTNFSRPSMAISACGHLH